MTEFSDFEAFKCERCSSPFFMSCDEVNSCASAMSTFARDGINVTEDLELCWVCVLYCADVIKETVDKIPEQKASGMDQETYMRKRDKFVAHHIKEWVKDGQ